MMSLELPLSALLQQKNGGPKYCDFTILTIPEESILVFLGKVLKSSFTAACKKSDLQLEKLRRLKLGPGLHSFFLIVHPFQNTLPSKRRFYVWKYMWYSSVSTMASRVVSLVVLQMCNWHQKFLPLPDNVYFRLFWNATSFHTF